MKPIRFWVLFTLMVITQAILYNYTPANPYVMVTIMPVIILLIPVKYSTHFSMFIAFAVGLAADILTDGIIGLNVLALVPVAACRKNIISLYFGDDMFVRKKNISFARNGVSKISTAILTAQALFLIVYIWADLAGSRPFFFCFLRFVASLAVSYPVGLLVTNCLTKETDGKWR